MRSALRCLLLFRGKRSSSLLNGLVSYWKLEEASGTRFDSVGTNNLTSNNSVGQGTGIQGKCASLVAASSQYLSIASNSTLQLGTGSFTITAWVQLASLPATNSFVVIKGTSGNTATWEYALFFQPGTPNSLRFRMSNGVSLSNSVLFSSPVINTWYFCLVWFDSVAQTVNLRVNNGTVNSTAYTSGGFAGTNGLTLGAGSSTGGAGTFWNGLIDETFLYNRVLTTAEQNALWNGGAGATFPFSGLGI